MMSVRVQREMVVFAGVTGGHLPHVPRYADEGRASSRRSHPENETRGQAHLESLLMTRMSAAFSSFSLWLSERRSTRTWGKKVET